jgi:hypothetical protein
VLDGEPDADLDDSCFTIDVACPTSRPYVSRRCDTAEICTYEREGVVWTYTCEDGGWSAASSCDDEPVCAPTPLAEVCRTPFTGTIHGATVELGPGGTSAFRPFEPDEPVRLVYGAQGIPMLFLRIRITGVDVPSCLDTVVAYEIDGVGMRSVSATPVEFHCGQTLTLYKLLPGLRCPPPSQHVMVSEEVVGIGTGTATVVVAGCD